MKRYLYCILTLMAGLLLISCHKDYSEQLRKAEAYASTKPDSALALLNQCNRYLMSAADEAHYAVIYTMAQDKSGLDVVNDSLLRIAYDYYSRHMESPMYPRCLYYMGYYYGMNDSTTLAEDCYRTAYMYADKYNDYHIAYMARAMLARSIAPYHPAMAVKMARQGLEIAEKRDPKNSRNRMVLLLTVAEAYMNSMDYYQCQQYYRKALGMARKLRDKQMLSYICQSMANTFMQEDEPDSALVYAQHAIKYHKGYDERLQMLYAITLIQTDSLEMGQQELANILGKTKSMQTKSTIYRQLQNLAFANEDLDKAYAIADSIATYEDLLYDQALRESHVKYSEALREQRMSLEEGNKARERMWESIFVVAVLAIIVLATIILYLMYLCSTKGSRVSKPNPEASLRQLAHLEMQSQMEVEMRERLQMHQSRMEEDLRRQQGESNRLRGDLMLRYLQKKLVMVDRVAGDDKALRKMAIDDEEWDEICDFLNETNNQFVVRFAQQFPDLAEKDVRFCMLIRLGLTTRDLANLYGISDRSAKQREHQFKSRLGLEDQDTTLREFIEQF